jgi:hypothetical protein
MNKLYVKIISVEPSILVRFASDKSKKPIDDYPPMLFGIPDITITTPEAFVESIRPQLEQYVQARDATESAQPIDVSSWIGYSTSVDMQINFADPVLESQIIAAQAVPEVVL